MVPSRGDAVTPSAVGRLPRTCVATKPLLTLGSRRMIREKDIVHKAFRVDVNGGMTTSVAARATVAVVVARLFASDRGVVLSSQDSSAPKRKQEQFRLQQPSVAACISGLARSWVMSRVRRSIWAHMIWPIVGETDVFFAIDESHSGRKYEPSQPNTANWRDEAYALFAPVYSARIGASESLGESLALCRSLVLARESIRGAKYAWILRLRPDATYRTALPPLTRWPSLSNNARVVWSTYIGGPSCSRSKPSDFVQKGVCLDDNFAIASRAALDHYFRSWPREGCHPSHCNECRLGCALHQGRVRVGSLPVELRLHRGVPKLRNKTADAANVTRSPLDKLADRIIIKYDLETQARSSREGQTTKLLADELAEAYRNGFVDAKHVLRFVVVEACDSVQDSLVEIAYDTDVEERLSRHSFHGLFVPFAHRQNKWLGCEPPPTRYTR